MGNCCRKDATVQKVVPARAVQVETSEVDSPATVIHVQAGTDIVRSTETEALKELEAERRQLQVERKELDAKRKELEAERRKFETNVESHLELRTQRIHLRQNVVKRKLKQLELKPETESIVRRKKNLNWNLDILEKGLAAVT